MPLRDEEKEKNLKPGTLTDRIADEWNEQNLEREASSRLLKVDELIGHFWAGNPPPPVYREDGTRDLEAEAGAENPEPLQHPRKFLVYVEYLLDRRLLKKVRRAQICGKHEAELSYRLSRSFRFVDGVWSSTMGP
jgi:hypothetical protein